MCDALFDGDRSSSFAIWPRWFERIFIKPHRLRLKKFLDSGGDILEFKYENRKWIWFVQKWAFRPYYRFVDWLLDLAIDLIGDRIRL